MHEHGIHDPNAEHVGPVEISCWDPGQSTAVCTRCFDQTSEEGNDRDGRLIDWAERHQCDPELVALLDAVLIGHAA